jgi:hypothetical protein
MTVIKYPMSFNDHDQARVWALVDLLGIRGTYGDFTKAVKFGIVLALSAINQPEKVYNGLDEPELKLFFQSVMNAELGRRKLAEAAKLLKEAEKV